MMNRLIGNWLKSWLKKKKIFNWNSKNF